MIEIEMIEMTEIEIEMIEMIEMIEIDTHTDMCINIGLETDSG